MLRSIRAMLVILATLAVAVAGVLGLAQTGSVKRMVENRLAVALAAPDGTRATLEGLEGFLPFEIRLGRLALRDQHGVWLGLREVHLAWSPRALLRGVLLVQVLEAGRIELIRPRSGGVKHSSSPRLPSLPGWLARLEVAAFRVGAIELGEDVFGQPATFALEGYLRGAGRHAREASNFELKAVRTDEPTATLQVAAALQRSRFALSVLGGETGSLLAAVTGVPGAGALSIHLNGEGPLEDWTGQMALRAEGLLTADLKIGLDLQQTPSIALAGDLRPNHTLLPPLLDRLLGQRVHLSLTALYPGMGDVLFEQLQIRTTVADLRGHGRIDPEAERFTGELRLALPDLTALGPIGGHRLSGQTDVEVSAIGAWLQPTGSIRIRARDLEAEGISGESAALEIAFEVLQPLGEGKGAASFQVAGAIDQLELAEGTSAPLGEVRWQAEAFVPPAGDVRLSRLRIETDAGSLVGSATLDPATLAGHAEVGLKLSGPLPVASRYASKIDYDLDLKAVARLAPHLETIDVDLSGRLDRLSGPPWNVEGWLGNRITLDARAEIVPWKQVVLRDVSLGAELLEASGGAHVDLASRVLSGAIEVSCRDLSPLGPLVGTSIAGAGDVTVGLGGTLAAPSARVVAKGRDLLVAGKVIDQLRLEVEGLSRTPSGTFRATAVQSGASASLRGAYQLAGSDLVFSKLTLAAGRSRITADLSIDMSARLVEGVVEGTITNLSPLQRVLGLALRGEIDFEAGFEVEAGRQNADLGLTARRVEYLDGRLTQMVVRAGVDDVFGRARLDASLEMEGSRVGRDVRFDRTTVRAKGDPRTLAVDARAAGHVFQKTEIAARTTVSLGDGVSIRLMDVSGKFGEETFALATPAQIEIAQGSLDLQALDFRLGETRLTARAWIEETRSSIEADLTGFALARIADFGGPRLEGLATARLQLEGSPRHPEGRMEIAVRHFRPVDPDLEDVAMTDIQLISGLAGERLRTRATVSGLTSAPIAGSFEVPLILELLPFDLRVPGEGRIAGRIDVEAQLDRLTAIVGLDDQRVGGALTANLEVRGTVDAPDVFGSVNVADGLYERGETGTVLRDIETRLEIRGDRMRLEAFTASDGNNGRLRGSGVLGHTKGDGWWLEAHLALERAVLIRRDDVTAALSGDLFFTGSSAQSLDVSGQLSVDRAFLTWEDDPSPDIPYLEVEEIGGTKRSSPAEGGDDRAFDLIGLDIGLAIPRRLFVRGRGLDSEWQGSLQVSGTSRQPALAGRLALSRGRLIFFGHRFMIDRARVDFSGEVPANPMLDLEATSRGRSVLAIVSLSGPARDAQLRLESVPPLPEDEVLAQLLFGRPVRDLGPGAALTLAQALPMLRGGNSLGMLGRTRRALGVDTLEVVGGERAGEVSLRAGNYLSDDVFFELEQSSDARSSGRAAVEVDTSAWTRLPMRLGAELTGRTGSGVGAVWRFDY